MVNNKLDHTDQNQNFRPLRAFGMIFADWSCDSSHFLTNSKIVKKIDSSVNTVSQRINSSIDTESQRIRFWHGYQYSRNSVPAWILNPKEIGSNVDADISGKKSALMWTLIFQEIGFNEIGSNVDADIPGSFSFGFYQIGGLGDDYGWMMDGGW
ncbi:hypothetical protein C1646_768058 [Rhizophagus diaphanus]|nr:hypothetical protein C1646_768058 [Rhizophagus diaphanus] [Rhizophagus sp. MUCL 43196]